ncbi:MAG: MgtC/SapB family protein [Elusimicrobiota bacterium]
MEHISQEAVRLLFSLVLGAAIGLEREVSDKAAGLRTNILICLGATLFTIISSRFTADPARIAAQLVSGVGFLGAGAIMRDGDRVVGLTTAAMIFIVAAIGMAVGYGLYTVAALTTATVLFVQLVFTRMDILIDDWRQRHNFKIVSKLDEKVIEDIKTIFREADVVVLRRKLMKKNDLFYSEWYTSGARLTQKDVVKQLIDSKDVLEVTY